MSFSLFRKNENWITYEEFGNIIFNTTEIIGLIRFSSISIVAKISRCFCLTKKFRKTVFTMAFHSGRESKTILFFFFFLQVKYKMKTNEKENSLVTGRVTVLPLSFFFFFNTADAKCKYFMKKKKRRKFFSLLLFIRYTLLSHTKKRREKKKENPSSLAFIHLKQQTQDHTINKMKVQKFFHDVQQ